MNQCVAPPTAKELSEQMAKASAAVQKLSTNTDPECLKCAEEAEIQAVILYPALGTPYVAPADEKKIRLFLIVEDKCVKEFGIDKGDARHAWYYIDTHLRLLPFKTAAKTSADLKGKKLYSSKDAAKAGIKVWYKGVHGSEPKDGKGLGWTHRLIDHEQRILANLRSSAVSFYVANTLGDGSALEPAFKSIPQVCDTDNHPLRHLFEIELDVKGLRLSPVENTMYTLAWMVTCVYKNQPKAFLENVSHWEHQDKLVYDFFSQMQRKKHHFAQPYVFDVDSASDTSPGKQIKTEQGRLKPFHPVVFKKKKMLHIGHLTDIHVSSRQFAFGRSKAAVLKGVSEPLGAKANNSFLAVRELVAEMKHQGADALFITGDLLDYNRNLDPLAAKGSAPVEQWKEFDLFKRLNDKELYPLGMDDMLVYSLVKFSYTQDVPVFMVTGNHEAYDVPYGISPRLNVGVAHNALKQFEAGKADRRSPSDPVMPRRGSQVAKSIIKYLPDDHNNKDGEKAHERINRYNAKRLNEGIPADHNLTIYEACLLYGPAYPQVIKPFNFVPANYDWFFTLFTPLSDFAVSYGGQTLIGLDWGDSEIMVNIDMGATEAWESTNNITGLPRADSSVNWPQYLLLKGALDRCKKGGKAMLFSHFAYINYDLSQSYSGGGKPFLANGNTYNNYTKGTFGQRREYLYGLLNNGLSHVVSGHSHRAGAYAVNVSHKGADTEVTVVGAYEPQPPGEPRCDGNYERLFEGEERTRVLVGSSGGSIGVQNECGELMGWNLKQPSGIIIKVDKVGVDEFRRVVVNKYHAGVPRFCVALDYIELDRGRSPIVWWRTANPRFPYKMIYWDVELPKGGMPPKGLTDREGDVELYSKNNKAIDYIEAVTFFVWNKKNKQYVPYETLFGGNDEMHIGGVIRDVRTNSKLMCIKEEGKFLGAVGDVGENVSPVFVEIKFNERLKSVSGFSHFDFSDPWYFPVEIGAGGSISRPCEQAFEIPVYELLGRLKAL